MCVVQELTVETANGDSAAAEPAGDAALGSDATCSDTIVANMMAEVRNCVQHSGTEKAARPVASPQRGNAMDPFYERDPLERATQAPPDEEEQQHTRKPQPLPRGLQECLQLGSAWHPMKCYEDMKGYEMTYASIRQVASVGCPFCSILWGNVGEA